MPCPWNISTSDTDIISNAFNKFFVEKIEDLKAKIDPTQVKDPLEKLKENMKNNKVSFALKTVNMKNLKLIVKKLKTKKSAGLDGMSQEQLKAGSSILVGPLQNIFNHSISTGEFPKEWKEAIVTPVHKKGDKSEFINYRPVSCLPAAAKLLELGI